MILRKGRKPDPKERQMAWIESGRTLSIYGGASQERGERWREGLDQDRTGTGGVKVLVRFSFLAWVLVTGVGM